jgi:DNA-binding response OmpR family regulator
MRVLLVEDDDAIAEPMTDGLEHHGFGVTRVATGADALAAPEPDLVVLDLGLPDMDGLDVCRALRARSPRLPILVVSARSDEVDRVVGLELGADDYLGKPFGLRELVARIRAVLRRTVGDPALAERAPSAPSAPVAGPADDTTEPSAGSSVTGPAGPAGLNERGERGERGDVTVVGPLRVDHRAHRVFLGGGEIGLTVKEYGVLALLAADPGAVVTRTELIERVWDEHWYGPTRTLDVHVAQLRRKLGDPRWIETVRSVGYRLAEPT